MGRLRAYVADLQSSLNAHLAGLGSHERLEIDGEWGEHTARAFGRVCRVLGLEPARNVRTFRARRRGHAAAHARGARARPGRRRRLRAAAAPSLRPRARPTRQRRWRRLRALRRRRRRARHPRATAGASRPSSCARPGASRLPVALACAIAREGDRLSQRLRPRRGAQPGQEPARRPAGGHRGQLPPVPGPPPPGARQPGRRADAADQPVACRTAPTSSAAAGSRAPTSASASSSSPATSAAWGCAPAWWPTTARARPRSATATTCWPARGAGSSACAAPARRAPQPDHRDRPGPGPAPRRHAADLPPGVAARCAGATSRPSSSCSTSASPAWSIDKRIDVDGEYGPMTRRAARQAVYALGISGTELAHGVTPELRSKLRRPSRRTPDEVAHAARRRGWLGPAAPPARGPRRAGGARLRAQAPRGGREPAVDQPRAAHRSLEPRDRHRRRAARGAATSPTPA